MPVEVVGDERGGGQAEGAADAEEALISAVAEPSRSAGSSSRMMLMPSGMTPADRPCNARPTIIGARDSLSAAVTDPATSITTLTSSIRRLPYMSPSRPIIGVATAAASRVAVTAQAVSDAGAFRRLGSSGTIGMTRVCISETTIPPKASTATTTFGRGGAAAPGAAVRGWAWDMVGPPGERRCGRYARLDKM